MAEFKNKSRKIARDVFWGENNRDTYQCPDCGRNEEEIPNGFEVHHKNGKPMDNRPSNLIGLCRLCHNVREEKKPSLEDIQHLRDNTEGSEEPSASADTDTVRLIYELSQDTQKKDTIYALLSGREAYCDFCDHKNDADSFKLRSGHLFCNMCGYIYDWSENLQQWLSKEDFNELVELSIKEEDDRQKVKSVKHLQRGSVIQVAEEEGSLEVTDEAALIIADADASGICYSVGGDISNGIVDRSHKLTDEFANTGSSILKLMDEGRLIQMHIAETDAFSKKSLLNASIAHPTLYENQQLHRKECAVCDSGLEFEEIYRTGVPVCDLCDDCGRRFALGLSNSSDAAINEYKSG